MKNTTPEATMPNLPAITLTADGIPSWDTSTAGKSTDRIECFSKHQGHNTRFLVYRATEKSMALPQNAHLAAADGLYLVPIPTVIAAHPIAEQGRTVRVPVGTIVNVDGKPYELVDDVPLHNPRLIPHDADHCRICGDDQ